jgi:hypothetical protein
MIIANTKSILPLRADGLSLTIRFHVERIAVAQISQVPAETFQAGVKANFSGRARRHSLVIRWSGMTDRTGYSVDTAFNSAVRRLAVVVLAIAGTAACGHSAPQITAAVGGASTPASPAADGGTPTRASPDNGGGKSAGCPTQGVGGDSIPPLCASPSPSTSTFGITPPASSTPSSVVCSVPAVTGISPSLGSVLGGDTVTITGTGFGSGEQIFFGSTPAEADYYTSDTGIIATSPPEQPGQTTVNITVTCHGSVSPVVAADEFSYVPATSPSPSPTSPATSPSPSAAPSAGS